jgi:hypothetical protein
VLETASPEKAAELAVFILAASRFSSLKFARSEEERRKHEEPGRNTGRATEHRGNRALALLGEPRTSSDAREGVVVERVKTWRTE